MGHSTDDTTRPHKIDQHRTISGGQTRKRESLHEHETGKRCTNGLEAEPSQNNCVPSWNKHKQTNPSKTEKLLGNSLATLWQLLVFAITIPYSPVLLPCSAPPEKEDETSATWSMRLCDTSAPLKTSSETEGFA